MTELVILEKGSDLSSSNQSVCSTTSPPTSDSDTFCHNADVQQSLQPEHASPALDCYVPVGIYRIEALTYDVWTWFKPKDPLIDDKSPLSRLAKAEWIQVFIKTITPTCSYARVFLLPDDVARRAIPRDDRNLRKWLSQLMWALDISKDAWDGIKSCECTKTRYQNEGAEEDSLFYLFNTIPSPQVQDLSSSDTYSQQSISALLKQHDLSNLRTPLYGYQTRTAACIVKREIQPRRCLDPRLASVQGPLGHKFHYDCHTGSIFRQPIEYEEGRGGILAESMGLGKTLICLTAILATKGHFPSVPPAYSTGRNETRPCTGTLAEMAASAASVEVVPWKFVWRDRLDAAQIPQTCLSLLKTNPPSYHIPPPPKPQMRRASMAKSKCIRLCSATLVVAPRNLISHWLGEIEQHFCPGTFRVLVLDSKEAVLPDPLDLLSYDILLFSTQRFEQEFQNLETRPDYQTPLLDLHFLRVIMDEGHEFASGSRNKAYYALARLLVERKWIVSGTPASGLLGIEVGMTAQSEATSSAITNEQALESRKKDYDALRERKILQNLRVLVEKFLDLRPWSNSKTGDYADWNTYIMPYDDGRRKPASLRNLLNSLCVRHHIADIEADISLPPLHNHTVYLNPCLYDRMSQNAFIIALISNAVTSERTDEDYMFHRTNRPALNQLVNNLRQSGFYWTSFSSEELAKTVQISKDHLVKLSSQSCITAGGDFAALEQAVAMGELILSSLTWKSLSELHEMGVCVNDFPSACRSWSIIDTHAMGPLMTGATQLWKAQSWIDDHLHLETDDLINSLSVQGEKALAKLWKDVTASQTKAAQVDESPDATAFYTGSPTTARKVQSSPTKSNVAEPRLTEQTTLSRSRKAIRTQKASLLADVRDQVETQTDHSMKPALKTSRPTTQLIDPSCELSRSCLSGFSSAKLTYLLNRIAVLHIHEKTLIFYEGDHIAYYIAQALDLIGVQYLIYTRTLDLALKSAYIATFNAKPTIRVLLMNLGEAAHGLHIASASRVFFINPVWQPDVEAQAIKRAHRIGQRRPVYVETLVLQDTIEAQMLQRRQHMSNQEHENAEKSLLDDAPMATIIQNAQLLPISPHDVGNSEAHFAKLESPIRLFGQNRQTSIDPSNPYADFIFPIESQKTKKMGVRKTTQLVSGHDLETHIVSDRSKRSLAEYSIDNELQPDEDNVNKTVENPGQTGLDSAAIEPKKKKKKRVGFVDEPALIPTPVFDELNTIDSAAAAAGPSDTNNEGPYFVGSGAAQPTRHNSIFGAGLVR